MKLLGHWDNTNTKKPTKYKITKQIQKYETNRKNTKSHTQTNTNLCIDKYKYASRMKPCETGMEPRQTCRRRKNTLFEQRHHYETKTWAELFVMISIQFCCVGFLIPLISKMKPCESCNQDWGEGLGGILRQLVNLAWQIPLKSKPKMATFCKRVPIRCF